MGSVAVVDKAGVADMSERSDDAGVMINLLYRIAELLEEILEALRQPR